MKKTILAASAAIILAAGLMSCSGGDLYSAPEFKHEYDLSFELVGNELMYYPYQIAVSGNWLLVFGRTADDNTVTVYDKGTGEEHKSGIKYGRGPLESISGFRRVSVVEDTVHYHELSGNGGLSFSVADFMTRGESSCRQDSLACPQWCSYYSELPGGKTLFLVNYSYLLPDAPAVRRLSICDLSGREVHYDGSPVADREKSFCLYQQPKVAFSPDGSKVAVSTASGALLELFDISSGIRLISECRFLEPKITCKNGGYVYQDDYVFGFDRMCASDNRIYAVYDGQSTSAEQKSASVDARPLLFKNIAVFDWRGNPISIYRSNYRIDSICPDPDVSDILYAILSDADGRKYIGRATL